MNQLQLKQFNGLPRYLQERISDYLRIPVSKRDESDRISIINAVREHNGDFARNTKPAYQ